TRRGDHRAMAAVRRRVGIPVMADESVFTPQDAFEVLRAGAADVLSLYPGKHGGVRTAQAIARMAEAAGVPCTAGSNLEREPATRHSGEPDSAARFRSTGVRAGWHAWRRGRRLPPGRGRPRSGRRPR